MFSKSSEIENSLNKFGCFLVNQNMDEDLKYFLRLSNQVNESQIQDLRDEVVVQPSKTKEEKSKKKMPVKEPKPEKPNKIRVVTLEAAPKNPEEDIKQEDNEVEEYERDESYDEEGSEEGQDNYKFSAIKVPVHPDLSMKKGKNPYQKLREARRQEAIDAQDPNSGLKNLRIAASTGKLPATPAQIEKSMKKKLKEKQRKYEKKLAKEAKEKNNDKKNKSRGGGGNKNFKNKMKNSRPNFKKSKK